jgi:hypothetical protein
VYSFCRRFYSCIPARLRFECVDSATWWGHPSYHRWKDRTRTRRFTVGAQSWSLMCRVCVSLWLFELVRICYMWQIRYHCWKWIKNIYINVFTVDELYCNVSR